MVSLSNPSLQEAKPKKKRMHPADKDDSGVEVYCWEEEEEEEEEENKSKSKVRGCQSPAEGNMNKQWGPVWLTEGLPKWCLGWWVWTDWYRVNYFEACGDTYVQFCLAHKPGSSSLGRSPLS